MVNGYRPASLEEALALLAQKELTPYAGGTDLMLEKAQSPREYLFIGALPELRQICTDGEYVRIGAAVTFTQALEDERVPALMRRAVSQIAAPAIRNAGTFGGNLGNGSAKADSVLIDFVLDAKLRLVSLRGERLAAVEDFCQGRKKLDLARDELIAEILLPAEKGESWSYHKVGGRSALAISRVSFAGVYQETEGRISRCAAAFGAVSDTVLRFRDLEGMLVGLTPAQAREKKEDFLAAVSRRMQLTAGRVSAEYRKLVCLNLLREFLAEHGI